MLFINKLDELEDLIDVITDNFLHYLQEENPPAYALEEIRELIEDNKNENNFQLHYYHYYVIIETADKLFLQTEDHDILYRLSCIKEIAEDGIKKTNKFD